MKRVRLDLWTIVFLPEIGTNVLNFQVDLCLAEMKEKISSFVSRIEDLEREVSYPSDEQDTRFEGF
jgi:hypothetical protein